MHYSSVHEKLKFHHQSGMVCYDVNILTRPTGVTGDVEKPFEATEFHLRSAKFKHSVRECTTLKCNQSINIRLRILFPTFNTSIIYTTQPTTQDPSSFMPQLVSRYHLCSCTYKTCIACNIHRGAKTAPFYLCNNFVKTYPVIQWNNYWHIYSNKFA